jgi:hypothetical protein
MPLSINTYRPKWVKKLMAVKIRKGAAAASPVLHRLYRFLTLVKPVRFK